MTSSIWLLSLLSFASGQDGYEFFEQKIRPVLVESCYECHNSHETAEADLAVDWRGGLLAKTANGTAVVPFSPEKSLLLKVLRHEIDGLQMPDGRDPLPAEVIQDFEKWIKLGAMDPRVEPPSEQDLKSQISWEAKFAKRKQRWCFQPIRLPVLPPASDWARQPIDRFILEKLELNGLSPNPPAKSRDLVRRLSYALTGLPPDQETIENYLNDQNPKAYERLVDQYLDSPRFGERWARHWMDWVRYADSHGSEGDPAIPFAYRYRDYLIRALNADVPYRQLVIEHLAGDLLERPRMNVETGVNESAIGPAHLRFVFHGFAPTDALDEKVRFTDDQINVFGKSFLGLTISCARCHDHKFDAISQRDYYALFGIFGSCRPAIKDINSEEKQFAQRQELSILKGKIRQKISASWLDDLKDWSPPHPGENLPKQSQNGPLKIWHELVRHANSSKPFKQVWNDFELEYRDQFVSKEISADQYLKTWDLSQQRDFEEWFPRGNGIRNSPSSAGEFVISSQADQTIDSILPGGVFTHSISKLHRGILDSPQFTAEDRSEVYLQIIGGGNASMRYVVQNYPRDGTVFPIHRLNRDDWHWHRFDLGYWAGDQVHLELATAQDTPIVIAPTDRSWFGIRRVIVTTKGKPTPIFNSLEDARELYRVLAAAKPGTLVDVANCYRKTIASAVAAWEKREMSDDQALLLNSCLKSGWLPNKFSDDTELQNLLADYRRVESSIPKPTRVPGVSEANPGNQPLFQRGDHRKPGDPVPRGFLSVINSKTFEAQDSGRNELANAIVADENPLTSRVIVNRIWLHLFGRGIVETPDNFGQLGAMPTHPELLDYLAARFRNDGWSIKKAIRMIVLSKTWRQDSSPSADAARRDPGNRWLSHANVRRLEAEAIRDTLLAVSGELDLSMFGPTVAANSNSLRRSIYVRANRNSMDHLLTTFDAPVPFSTVGRRNVTNVPDQALALLNGDFVIARAARLGTKIGRSRLPEEQRLGLLIRSVLRRPAADSEIQSLQRYLSELKSREELRAKELSSLKREREQILRDIDALLGPAKAKLQNAKTQVDSTTVPHPFAQWEFTKRQQEPNEKLPIELVGSAELTTAGLRLDGAGFARTRPLDIDVSEKTLEVILRLDSLQQRGGGAMSIQDLTGDKFDSIVFAEQSPLRWMAGSEFFRRTQPIPQAIDEKSKSILHVALVYESDGTIRAYRNGRPYGRPYNAGTQSSFAAGDSQLVFGLRHGTQVSQGRMLTGWLIAARLYNRALSHEEIAASFAVQPVFSDEQILASLPSAQRKTVESLRSKEKLLRQEESKLEAGESTPEPYQVAAHLLLNLKELIYVR